MKEIANKGKFSVRDSIADWHPKRNSESGVILAIAAMLILVLVACVFLLINFGYISVVRTELRGAVDAAARAGAVAICSDPNEIDGDSSGCFANARELVFRTLAAQRVHGSGGRIENLNFTEDDDGLSTTFSRDDGVTLTVERGLYSPTSGFTSVEGSFSAEHPGVPRALVTNAIRIEVVLTGEFALIPSLFSTDRITESAIAVAGETRQVCAAPFAIPVSNLVSPEGRFLSQSLGSNIMFFGRADRFCSGSEPCGAIPATFYEPGVTRGDYCAPGTCGPKDAPSFSIQSADDWRVQEDTARDRFGVIALPADEPSSDLESRIIEVLKNDEAPCFPINLGDRLKLLPEGLKTAAADEAVWNRIRSSFQGIQPFGSAQVKFADAFGGKLTIIHNRCALSDVFNLGSCAAGGTHNGNGVIGSHRSAWFQTSFGVSKPPAINETPTGIFSSDCKCKSLVTSMEEKCPFAGNKQGWGFLDVKDGSFAPVWMALVPVVADFNTSAYGYGLDYSLAEVEDLKVVGFVPLNIYDVSVGYDSPDVPAVEPASSCASNIKMGFRYKKGPDTIRRANLVLAKAVTIPKDMAGNERKVAIGTSDPYNRNPGLVE